MEKQQNCSMQMCLLYKEYMVGKNIRQVLFMSRQTDYVKLYMEIL